MINTKTHVTEEQLQIAIQWLENNEGDGAEGEACRAVAEKLKAEITSRMARSVAREHKVPIKIAREALAKAQEKVS